MCFNLLSEFHKAQCFKHLLLPPSVISISLLLMSFSFFYRIQISTIHDSSNTVFAHVAFLHPKILFEYGLECFVCFPFKIGWQAFFSFCGAIVHILSPSPGMPQGSIPAFFHHMPEAAFSSRCVLQCACLSHREPCRYFSNLGVVVGSKLPPAKWAFILFLFSFESCVTKGTSHRHIASRGLRQFEGFLVFYIFSPHCPVVDLFHPFNIVNRIPCCHIHPLEGHTGLDFIGSHAFID